MIKRLKLRILRYIVENFDDLLALDLKVARIAGAPAPHTLSSYAYQLEQEGKRWGKLWRPVIDYLFRWLMDQEAHCRKDYERVSRSR
jgi:hypothetical protein